MFGGNENKIPRKESYGENLYKALNNRDDDMEDNSDYTNFPLLNSVLAN